MNAKRTKITASNILSLSLVSFGSSSSSLSSEPTSSPSSNKTNFLSRRSITPNSTSMTDVLMVTTSMGMLNRVHSYTTHLRPAVPLHSKLVISITSLEERFLSPTTTCNLANHCTTATWNNLLRTRWKLDPGGIIIGVVTNNNGIIPRSSSENPTVTNMVLNVANDSSFRDRSKGQHISNHKGSFLTTIHELSGVHTLGGDEQFLLFLVTERVAENDAG